MSFSWRNVFRAWFAVPPSPARRPSLLIGKFEMGVCPGCRGLRTASSTLCEHCGDTARVSPDA